ncbi:MAG: DUF433 domain-containing protein [Bacteroidota bacterium]
MQAATSFKLGNGLFTLSDVSTILNIDYRRVYAWWRRYWHGNNTDKSHFKDEHKLDFGNLIEFYVVECMVEAGVRPSKVFIAHDVLIEKLKLIKPFVKEEVLNGIKTDGEDLFLEWEEEMLTLDRSGQFNFKIINDFIDKIKFSSGVAEQLWPLGKQKSIVIDPKVQFGQPVIAGTRIQSEVLYLMHEAGEPTGKIASIYDLTPQQVSEAIEYHSAA